MLDGADFDFSSILDFAKVISFSVFFVIYVIIWYQTCSNHIHFISIWILIYENLGLDTIYRHEVWNWRPYWIFSCFSSFYPHNNGLPCCIMCLSDSLTKKYRFRLPNHDPTWSNFRDIGNLRFWGGHFEKWPTLVVSPSYFSGNIMVETISGGPVDRSLKDESRYCSDHV